MAASASPTGCPPPRPPPRYVVVALSFHVAPSSLVSGGGQQEESSRSLVHASGRQHFFPAENLERNNTYAENRADCNTIYRIFTIRWTSQPSASPFDCIANVVYICGCHHASCLTFIAGSQRAVTAWEASFPLVRSLFPSVMMLLRTCIKQKEGEDIPCPTWPEGRGRKAIDFLPIQFKARGRSASGEK